MRRLGHLGGFLLVFFVVAPLWGQTRTIDDFASAAAWTAAPSDGVSLKIGQDAGRTGSAMRLDFDFQHHAGYAIARRNVDLDLPANYEFTFAMRADAPVNNLELKLIDATGDNVWWLNRRDFTYPREWTEIATRKRQISFAWGPLGGGEIHHVAAIEIVVTASTGGKGTVWIDDLALSELPPAAGPVTHGALARRRGCERIDARSRSPARGRWSAHPLGRGGFGARLRRRALARRHDLPDRARGAGERSS